MKNACFYPRFPIVFGQIGEQGSETHDRVRPEASGAKGLAASHIVHASIKRKVFMVRLRIWFSIFPLRTAVD